MRDLRRRDVLKLAGGLALAACASDDDSGATPSEGSVDAGADGTLPHGPDFTLVPVDDAAFPYGVQAGAADATSATFWSFAVSSSSAVLRVWLDEAWGQGPPLVEATVEAAEGFLKHRVVGLQPGQVHRYAFFDDAGEVRSTDGRLRAAFAPGTRTPLRIGATACTSAGRAPFTPLPLLAERELDVFCHLGDMSYNDGSTTTESYRRDWARILTNPEYRALLPTVGSLITWDDHELGDGAELELLTAEQIAAGKAAFFESVPTERRAGDVFWASHRWGDTAEIFVLDVRHERTPEAIMSEAQFSWLLEALRASPCHFKVIMTSVPVANLPPAWAAAAESWMKFPASRDRLLDHLTSEGIGGVVFLAGDYHVSAVWRIEDAGPRAGLYEVLCGPGGSAHSQRFEIAATSPAAHRAFFPEGRIDFASDRMCATFVTLDADADSIRVEIVAGDDGEVLYDETLPASG